MTRVATASARRGLAPVLAWLMAMLAAGCGGGGNTDHAAAPLLTTAVSRVNTATFPNGSFPKAMALLDGELWVTGLYTKLIDTVDLGTLTDRDGDTYPDVCENEKGYDADDPANPDFDPPNPTGVCGDVTYSQVTVLDAATLTVKARVDVPREANYIAAGGGSVYVTHARNGWLTKIDAATRKVVHTERIGIESLLGQLALDLPNDRLFVMDSTTSSRPRDESWLLTVSNLSTVQNNTAAFTVDKVEIPATLNLPRRAPALAYLAAEQKVYVAAFDQKRIYQVDATQNPPAFATEVKTLKGSRLETADVTGDPSIINLVSKAVPLLSASNLILEGPAGNLTFPVQFQFLGRDNDSTETLQAYFLFTVDTDGNGETDRTYHGVLDLEKGAFTIYDFVIVSAGKVTTEDKNKIKTSVRVGGETMVAKDYQFDVTFISNYEKDGEEPGGIKLFSHAGTNYLGVVYSDDDKVSVVTLPDQGLISAAIRFGNLEDTCDYPQDLLPYDGFPTSTETRLYITCRNANALQLYKVDFTQGPSSSLALEAVQHAGLGQTPFTLLPSAAANPRFYVTLFGESSVVMMESTR